MRRKIIGIYGLLVAANIAIWAFSIIAFYHFLLGTAFLAYGFGLRHAVDHIAAIDNIMRKLRQGGKRPVSAGLFFHCDIPAALLR